MPQPPAQKPPGELSWRFFGSLNPFPTSAKTRNVFFPSKSTSPPPSPRTPASNFNQRAGNHPDKWSGATSSFIRSRHQHHPLLLPPSPASTNDRESTQTSGLGVPWVPESISDVGEDSQRLLSIEFDISTTPSSSLFLPICPSHPGLLAASVNQIQ
uniref:Uncharacterized protein n=1 Tax=Moniliophthora roreri TaxID=221103 RepID=A0A0W0GE53_MONRR